MIVLMNFIMNMLCNHYNKLLLIQPCSYKESNFLKLSRLQKHFNSCHGLLCISADKDASRSNAFILKD